MQNKPWRYGELKECEETLPRIERNVIWRRRRDCARQRQEWDAAPTALNPKLTLCREALRAKEVAKRQQNCIELIGTPRMVEVEELSAQCGKY